MSVAMWRLEFLRKGAWGAGLVGPVCGAAIRMSSWSVVKSSCWSSRCKSKMRILVPDGQRDLRSWNSEPIAIGFIPAREPDNSQYLWNNYKPVCIVTSWSAFSTSCGEL